MPANEYTLYIEQGTTFTRTVVWRDSTGTAKDVTGYTAALQIRETIDSDTVLVSLTSSAGIAVGTTNGQFVITMTATQTSAIKVDKAVYDLEVTKSAVVTRLLQGDVVVSREVTR